ncbi:MAG: hypothetical protein LAN83_10745 [Acidobacteriia bacterium]|nr:hypothetical protein [Terriglobia bacterium]
MFELYARLAHFLVYLIECMLIVAFSAMIWTKARRADATKHPGFVALERQFARLARRRTLAVITVGLFVLTVRAALIPVIGIPLPQWDDEYSYLLAGKTFAAGKLTNPPHPMWVHLETFHVIQHPTYMSMYPPAQGLVLAAGLVLARNAWVGVWLITAGACAALTWMLQGWMPPGWALYGGLIAALRLGILSYWTNSYFTTAISALGGALILGALPRLKRRPKLGHALLMAMGLVILANSRPYEGFVLSVPVAIALLVWLLGKHRPPIKVAVLRVVLPVVLVLGITGAGMAYYFWRVTGSAFRMPYQVDRAAYAVAPYFIWQKMSPAPVYHHADIQDYYLGYEAYEFRQTQSVPRLVLRMLYKMQSWWVFYVGFVLTIPLLAIPWVLRDRRMQFILWASGIFFLGTILETWSFAHYVAPATGLFYLVLVQCMRHLRTWRWKGTLLGPQIVRMVFAVCVAMILVRVTAAAAHLPIEPHWPRGNLDRGRAVQLLERTPGLHLVIVHYGNKHKPEGEWVSNEPDIDRAKIVWARDMGESQNRELLEYFKDRKVWTVDADTAAPRLEPYAAPPTGAH